jgi:hypothetical protein
MSLVTAIPVAALATFRHRLEQEGRAKHARTYSSETFLRSNTGVGGNYDRLLHTFQREYGLDLEGKDLEDALALSHDCVCELNILLDEKLGRHDFNTEKCSAIKGGIINHLAEWQTDGDGYNKETGMDYVSAFREDFQAVIEEIVQLPDEDFQRLVTLKAGQKIQNPLDLNQYANLIGNAISELVRSKFDERNPFIL